MGARSSRRIRVFISSTIYDFADLRSAVKFWLEELGYEVMLSEFNDFDRRPDAGTFESCFETIRTCDYFVLLVGARKGSQFSDGTSVTQQEYRVAVEQMRLGLIVPVVLIRQDVLAVIRNLEVLTNNGEVQNETIANAAKMLQDPSFTGSFIREIRETQVPSLMGDVPGSVWTYSFSNFDDVAQALRIALRAQRNVRLQSILANLLAEVRANLSEMVTNYQGAPVPAHFFLDSIRRNWQIDNSVFDQQVAVDRSVADHLWMFGMFGGAPATRIRTAALSDALASGELLAFRPTERILESTPALEGLATLHDWIDQYRSISSALKQPAMSDELNRLYIGLHLSETRFEIQGYFILWNFVMYNAMVNVLRLLIETHRWITEDSHQFTMPVLMPKTPDQNDALRLAEERAEPEVLISWLNNAYFRDLITGLSTANEEDIRAGSEANPQVQRIIARAEEMFSEMFGELFPDLYQKLADEGPEQAMQWLREEIQKRAGNE